MTDFPRRGEIWTVDFNPGRGSEQKGVRPGLVVQNDTGNEHSATTIIAAVTSTLKPFPFMVKIPRKAARLRTESMVNLAQVLTVDKRRLVQKLGELDPEQMRPVDRALKISLHLGD